MKVLAAFAALLAASPAFAWSSSAGDGSCTITEGVEDGNLLVITEGQKAFDAGVVLVGMRNPNWSIAEGDEVGKVTFRGGPGHFLTGVGTAIDQAFYIAVPRYRFNIFAALVPTHITVERNDRRFAEFSGVGMEFALQEWRDCRAPKVAADKTKKDEAQRQFEKDPFAK